MELIEEVLMKHSKYLLGIVLTVLLFATSAFALQEGPASPDEIVTINGIKVLGEIDLANLRVCADCGYEVVDQPQFESVNSASQRWNDNELVLSVSFNGVSKAFPLDTLAPVRFHVANDDFGGTPLTVSFCPICFSAVVFKQPVIDGQFAQFATAGLYNNDLVMYDNVSFTLWQQFTGEPLAGPMVGEMGLLERVPADILPFGAWAAANPEALVFIDPTLSLPRRSNIVIEELLPYEAIAGGGGRNQDVGDARLDDRDIVVGIVVDGKAKAYLEDAILNDEILNDVVGDAPVLVFVEPVSTQIKFFRRLTGDTSLTFELNDSGLVDSETGTTWNFDGLATSGPIAGTQLVEIAGLPSYWFAWVSFHPETELFDGN